MRKNAVGERQLKTLRDVVERFLRVRRVAGPQAQMNLNFARSRENRRIHVRIARVNRLDALLHGGFTHACHAQFAVKHSNARAEPLQPRQNLFMEHGFQFARRAGEKRDPAAMVFKPQSRRGAARIFEHFRAFRHHCLPHVDRGHFAAEAAGSGPRCIEGWIC